MQPLSILSIYTISQVESEDIRFDNMPTLPFILGTTRASGPHPDELQEWYTCKHYALYTACVLLFYASMLLNGCDYVIIIATFKHLVEEKSHKNGLILKCFPT